MENGLLWNKVRYTLYSPFYDLIVAPLKQARKKAVESIRLEPGEKLLIVGAGTGLDLEFLPAGVDITAIDITPAMIEKTRARAARLGIDIDARVMNAQALEFEEGSFDAVALHLVLAVVPDPFACITEAARVLKPDGRISVFDKFLPESGKASLARRTLNLFTSFLATDINRRLEPMLTYAELKKVTDEPVVFGGLYRMAKVEKRGSSPAAQNDNVR